MLLADQDGSRWDRDLIAEGHALVRWCLRRARPGPYQLQAAISAVHCGARTAAETDWAQVLALYDQLSALTPTPVVALNRAVALAELHGADVALPIVEDLALGHYQPWHVARADLLRRLGRGDEAADAYATARQLSANEPERRFLEMQLAELATTDGGTGVDQ